MIIKVCGLREAENIRRVEMLEVDWLGFIFYPPSPRYVPENSENVEAIGRCTKNKVGVFVNETVGCMLEKAKLFQLDILQLHGNETPEACLELRHYGYPVIKAFSIAAATDFHQTERYQNCCDYYLFDTPCAGFGGSGKRFSWNLLSAYQGETPFFLSGGITPDCSADIMRLNHPRFVGIDLNSGFEIYPALKDVRKISDFITTLGHYFTENHREDTENHRVFLKI